MDFATYTEAPRVFDLGSEAHVGLIKRAIRAKLEAHPNIARAFAATAPRPIVHKTGYPDPPDAEFPAAVFCCVRSDLRDELTESFAILPEERAEL